MKILNLVKKLYILEVEVLHSRHMHGPQSDDLFISDYNIILSILWSAEENKLLKKTNGEIIIQECFYHDAHGVSRLVPDGAHETDISLCDGTIEIMVCLQNICVVGSKELFVFIKVSANVLLRVLKSQYLSIRYAYN